MTTSEPGGNGHPRNPPPVPDRRALAPGPVRHRRPCTVHPFPQPATRIGTAASTPTARCG